MVEYGGSFHSYVKLPETSRDYLIYLDGLLGKHMDAQDQVRIQFDDPSVECTGSAKICENRMYMNG